MSNSTKKEDAQKFKRNRYTDMSMVTGRAEYYIQLRRVFVQKSRIIHLKPYELAELIHKI